VTCVRLEDGVLLGSLGEAADPHVEECPDCRASWASYTRIAEALAAESSRPLPGDWMDRMSARLATDRLQGSQELPVVAPEVGAPEAVGPAGRKGWLSPGWWLGGGFSAGAAVASAVTVLLTSPPAASFRTFVEQGAVRYRSAHEARHVGDVLRVEARSGGAEHFELRVYLDGERLVLRCPGSPEPACRPDDDGLLASYTFEQVGLYEIYWLVSGSPVSAPVGSLDQDLDAAFDAGAELRTKERIPVD
jgi:hypothetical protein